MPVVRLRVHTCNAVSFGGKPQVLHSAGNRAHLLPLWHHLFCESLPPHADCNHVGDLQTGPHRYVSCGPLALHHGAPLLYQAGRTLLLRLQLVQQRGAP